MEAFSPLDLIHSYPWSQSFFTTYALSLSFFEAVVLDALVRKNVERTLILADIDGVRAAVAEYGSRCAGRVYEVEPVAVEHGCFHAKLMALISATEAHLVVGSGNLTFGGWGSNLECVEHLHPGVAGDAFDDAADFLESLASAPWIKHRVEKPCEALAGELRRFASIGVRNGNIRLVHGLERSILDQMAEFSTDLGGAEQLTLAAPFHDGVALDRLCSQLGLDHAYVHSHSAGMVAGSFGSHWPGGTKAKPVAIALLADDSRRLHAKAFEIVCRRGRIVLSGSANATLAGLDRARNVELCVARIQRNPVVGWMMAPSSPPVGPAPAQEEETVHTKEGVLRAVLEGDTLNGWILTPFPAGRATVAHVTASDWSAVGEADVGSDGTFTILARDIEHEAWTAQRLILKVTSAGGVVASGFLSFAAFAEIKRRLGGASSGLLAVLAGTETPEDVAAAMIWFSEHPEYLSAPPGAGIGSHHPTPAHGDVSVSTLLNPIAVETASGQASDASGKASWRRFVDLILTSFRRPRGPIGDDEDESDEGAPSSDSAADHVPPKPPHGKHSYDRHFRFVEKLLDSLLAKEAKERSHAFWFAHFLCDRVEPDPVKVKSYLDRLMVAFADGPPLLADAEAVAAAALVWSTGLPGADDSLRAARAARRRLLRMGASLDWPLPDMRVVQGFVRALAPNVDFLILWDKIRAVRTPQEEIKSFRLAGASLGPEYPYLIGTQELSNMTSSVGEHLVFMTKFDGVCPHCHLTLPTGQAYHLREGGVARAECCGRILLCEEI